MTPEQIRDKYEPRARAILEKIRAAATSLGAEAWEVDDMTDDDYSWNVYVRSAEQVRDGVEDQGVDFTFRICESENWDGEEGGVNFMLDIVAYGGEILGCVCPQNYTENVWVNRDDAEAIEARFALVEGIDHERATTHILNERFRNAETVSP